MHQLWLDLMTFYAHGIPPVVTTVVLKVLLILLLFFATRVIVRGTVRLIRRLMHLNTVRVDERKRNTLESLFDNLARYVLYFVFILISLQTLGLHVEALLAGAGIAGVAIGFGAQSLIKDLLTGFFILFEDQYGVGDIVTINGVSGTVESIGMRLSRVKSATGELHIIPNGQILQVTNFSKHNSMATIDVGVSYQADIDRAIEVMKDIVQEVADQDENAVGPVQVLGVQTITDTSVRLRVIVECKPMTHFAIERVALYRIHQEFAQRGIESPYPQSVVWLRDASQSQLSKTSSTMTHTGDA